MQRAERDRIAARPYIDRKTSYRTTEMLESPLIKLITGPRRAGKSVYAMLMLKGRNFAYLNFDDKLLLDRWDDELVERTLDEVYPGYEYLMLDEVQNLPGWDLWVSKLYRNGKNLVITGSNANMLSSEMATVLTGRYLQIEMLPFSLAEVMAAEGIAMRNTCTTMTKLLTGSSMSTPRVKNGTTIRETTQRRRFLGVKISLILLFERLMPTMNMATGETVAAMSCRVLSINAGKWNPLMKIRRPAMEERNGTLSIRTISFMVNSFSPFLCKSITTPMEYMNVVKMIFMMIARNRPYCPNITVVRG